jgi:hypothetical protein
MMFSGLIFSAIFLAIVNAVVFTGGRKGTSVAVVISGLVAFAMCAGFSLLLATNAICVAVAGVAAFRKTSPRLWFFALSFGMTAVTYIVIGGLFAIPQMRAWQRQQAVYPMESLADRLAYENRPRTKDSSRPDNSRWLSCTEERFDQEALVSNAGVRVKSLERLHAGVVKQFIDSPGFGYGRMRPSPRPEELERTRRSNEQEVPGPFPQKSPPYESPPLILESLTKGEPDFAEAHLDNAVSFLNPFDFGYVRDREHVAGFQSHQFLRNAKGPERWQVERLDLVGLLKYDAPVVYLTENLPRMDELRDAPTRPLDSFEQQALAGLRNGEDLLTQHTGSDRLRMLGSLRAVKQCTACHQAQRGELLGAFSYKLVRAP